MNTIYRLLTPEQRRTCANNRNKRWKLICGTSKGIAGFVLHHKDPTLIYKNPDRYIQWLSEDLEIMSKADHVKFHRTGQRHNEMSKIQMSVSHKHKRFTEEVVKNARFGIFLGIMHCS